MLFRTAVISAMNATSYPCWTSMLGFQVWVAVVPHEAHLRAQVFKSWDRHQVILASFLCNGRGLHVVLETCGFDMVSILLVEHILVVAEGITWRKNFIEVQIMEDESQAVYYGVVELIFESVVLPKPAQEVPSHLSSIFSSQVFWYQ